MSTMVMESFGQTFVVAAPPVHKHDDDDDDECVQAETDEDSFYDEEDGQSSEEEDEEEEESDGSIQGGPGYLGTAKYFAGSARGFEPEMMGFSDSFVTDQDCSERLEESEDDFGSPNSSPDSSNKDNMEGSNMEFSVHEDVLSFDKMLGKRQSSTTSLGGTSTASTDLLQFTVSTTSGHSQKSAATRRSHKGHHQPSRDRSRSRSNSQRAKHRPRSTSRSSQDGIPVRCCLMPPDGLDDEQEDGEDLLSIIPAVAANQPPQQLTRPRPGRKKSLGNDEKIIPPSSNTTSSRNHTNPNTRRDSHSRTPDTSTNRPVRTTTLKGARRDSDLSKRGGGGDSTPPQQQPQPETTPRNTRRVGRRGSIETRRLQQQRRGSNIAMVMDSSSRRSSGGETGLDSSNDASLRHSDPSLRHSSSRAAATTRRLDSKERTVHRSSVIIGSTSGNGMNTTSAAERRRSRTNGGSLLSSPELIAEKLWWTGDEHEQQQQQDELSHSGVYDELRRSQYRNVGRRRASVTATTAGGEAAARRGSVDTTRMASQKQLSLRQLRRSDPSAEDLVAVGNNTNNNTTKIMTRRGINRSTDHTSGVPTGSGRALRNSATGTRSRPVRRVRTTDLVELSGGNSIDDESGGGRHDSSRRESRKMGSRASQRSRTMHRCRSEPTDVLHDILHADIDDDTVAAFGTEDTKKKALQRSQATAALSKALAENKAEEVKKVLQIQ